MNTITVTDYDKKKNVLGTNFKSFATELNIIDSGWTKDTLLILNDVDLKVCRIVDLIIDGTKNSVVAWHLMYIDDEGKAKEVYTENAPTFYKDLTDAKNGTIYRGTKTYRTYNDCILPCVDEKYCDHFKVTDPDTAWDMAEAEHFCQYSYDSEKRTMTYWNWDGLNSIEGSVMVCPRLLFNGSTFYFGNDTWGIENLKTYPTKDLCDADNIGNINIKGFENGEISEDTKDKLFP